MRRPSRLLMVLVLVLVAAGLGTVAWLWWGTTASEDPGIVRHGHPPDAPYRAFYEPPSPLPSGAPGTLIRAESFEIQPPGARFRRLLYHSRTAADEDIAVSGLLITPATDPLPGGFPLVTFAHPTVGISEKCAVSANLFVPLIPADVQNFYQIYFEPFVRAGFAVVATDYQGMGAPGPYSYLVGEVEGRNVLDIARAARQIDGVQISARVAIVGHSQGGHGGLFARQIAAEYAPELTVIGSAFAAPAADLRTILDAVLNRTGRTPLTGAEHPLHRTDRDAAADRPGRGRRGRPLRQHPDIRRWGAGRGQRCHLSAVSRRRPHERAPPSDAGDCQLDRRPLRRLAVVAAVPIPRDSLASDSGDGAMAHCGRSRGASDGRG